LVDINNKMGMTKNNSKVPKEDWEIIDMEDGYVPNEETKFSHQQLVMKIMDKCLVAGCEEMREGYFNEKRDRGGNIVRTYIQDTRNIFIESVKTLQNAMSPDIDKTFKNKLKELEGKLKKKRNAFCLLEEKWWDSASTGAKDENIRKGIRFCEGLLHKDFQYHKEYILEEVKIYREILSELNKLTKRLEYYKQISLEA
jgi:hypothetical protein